MSDAIMITARLKSTRLSKKVVRKVGGKEIIGYQIDRLKANTGRRILLCTSVDAQDDELAELAGRYGIDCFRGSEEDVIKRYHDACREYGIDRFYIVYGDEPFVDIPLMERTFAQLDVRRKIVVKNDSFPVGTFGYGMTLSAIREIDTRKTSTRNEVWGDMVASLDIEQLSNPCGMAGAERLRLTIDYAEDLLVFEAIIGAIGGGYLSMTVPELGALYAELNLQEVNGFRTLAYNARIADQAKL